MRILLLRKRGEWAYGSPLYFHEFEQELAKEAECIFAGEGWPQHKPGETVDQTVKRLYGNDPPDWVIDWERIEKLNPKRSYLVGQHLTDLHGRLKLGIRNSAKLLKHLNSVGYDALFMKTKYIYNTTVPPTYFTDNLKPRWFFLPYSVNPRKFYPRNKIYDITMIGSMSKRYPIRSTIWHQLEEFCYMYRLTSLMSNQAPVPSWTAAHHQNENPNYYIRKRYAEALGQSRFFAFCPSIYNYPIQKYFEVPASGCVAVAGKLIGGVGEELGFIDGETYVEVTRLNWEKKLLYYIHNPYKASKIIENGRKLIMEHHTHEIRVQEFICMLEEFL